MTDRTSDSDMLPDARLLLAKYFYSRGCDILRDGGLFDPGLAVSLFQDAVEIMLLACGTVVHASPKEKTGFEALWDEVNRALVAHSRTPLRMKIQVINLNKARVNFKHSGQVPDARVAESCRLDTSEFLSWAANEYFDKEFASLSLVTFVVDEAERDRLQQALELLNAQDRTGALLKCSEALSQISARRGKFYGHGILVQGANIDPKVRQFVNNEIAELRKQIWDLESLLFAEACGVSASDFLVVREVMPKTRGTEVEFPVAVEWLTDANVRWCIDFLAQYSIGLSQRQRSPEKFFAAYGLV